jgi:hypothetical protein
VVGEGSGLRIEAWRISRRGAEAQRRRGAETGEEMVGLCWEEWATKMIFQFKPFLRYDQEIHHYPDSC